MRVSPLAAFLRVYAALLLAPAARAAANFPSHIILWHCDTHDCAAVPPSNCQVASSPLPTNGSCTLAGATWFSAVPGGGSAVRVRGFSTSECGGAADWGDVSLALDGPPGCRAVSGGRGGGAYATPFSANAAPPLSPALALARGGGGLGGGAVELFSCGRPDCATVPPNSVCGLVAHQLPTNGTCTWNNGAYCFTATMDGDGNLDVTGYRWGGGCACGGDVAWGTASGIDVGAGLPAGCQPVQGGYGGGAYAQWSAV